MFDTNRLRYKLSMVFGHGWRRSDSCSFAPGHNILTIRQAELATDYDNNWVGRYYANRSDIKTVNLIKIDNMQISKSAGASPTDENFFRGNLSGDYKSDVNILSMSAKWIY